MTRTDKLPPNPPAPLHERLCIFPQEHPDGTVVWMLDLWGRHYDSAGIIGTFATLAEAEAVRADIIERGDA